MITCPYLDIFPYINDAIHEKWNIECNEKDDKLKQISSDTRSWKKNNRWRNDKIFIISVRADHTILTHGYLIEGLPVPECELCHSHAMTVKRLLTDCANQASLRFRFFDGSNPKPLEQISGRNRVNWNTKKFLKESNIYNRALNKNLGKKPNIIQTHRAYLHEDWSLYQVINRRRFVYRL